MELVYYTVAQEQTWEQKIERSRFIGQAAPVADADEAQAFLSAASKRKFIPKLHTTVSPTDWV